MLDNLLTLIIFNSIKTAESSLRKEVSAQVSVPGAQQGDTGGAQVQLPLRQRRLRKLPAVEEVGREVLQQEGAQVEEADGVRAGNILPQGLPSQEFCVRGKRSNGEGQRAAKK